MRKHRSIKVLKNDADHKNSIKAQYQLFKNYKIGRFVEQDIDNERFYFRKLKENLTHSRFRLKSIKLINFRGFSNLSVDLSSDYVVLAANNGYGKTGVLDSVFNGLTWIVRNLKANNANGNFIRPEDIRVGENVDSASVILEVSLLQGEMENSTYSINLSKTHDDAEERQESFYQEFKSLAEMYREVSSLGFGFPVIAYYSVERGNAIKRSDFKKSLDELLKEYNSKDYYTNTSSAPKFEFFLAWMLSVNSKRLLNDAHGTYRSIQLSNLKTLKDLQDLKSDNPEVIKLIQNLQEKIDAINVDEPYASADSIERVFSAIYKFMPEIKNLSFSYNNNANSIDLTCIKHGCRISVNQLSQGEKTMLSLVCDISLRLISANPGSKNPFAGDGIVIIDEIDLHLHPIWQQTILIRLRETFPNIQFVISTHSSNVLSTSYNHCIRKIAESKTGVNGNYDIYIPEFSLGAETSALQEDIQDVSSRPLSLEITQKLYQYKQMVTDDKWDSTQAEELFNELCEWGEGHDAIINKLRIDVTLRKRRRERK